MSKLLHSRQKRALSRLYFAGGYIWRTPLKLSTVATMTGLKHLHIFYMGSWASIDKESDDSLSRFIQLRVANVKVIVYERIISSRQIRDMRTAREEAVGWEELLMTGETKYKFKW